MKVKGQLRPTKVNFQNTLYTHDNSKSLSFDDLLSESSQLYFCAEVKV